MANLIFALIGLFAGVASGVFGIGGGIVIVPALVVLAGFSQHKATGTSLAVLLPPVGLAATLEYYRHGFVDIKAALLIAASLFIGGWLGAIVASRLTGNALKLTFGIALLLLGVHTVLTAAKEIRAEKVNGSGESAPAK